MSVICKQEMRRTETEMPLLTLIPTWWWFSWWVTESKDFFFKLKILRLVIHLRQNEQNDKKNRLNWTGKVHDLDMSTMSMSGSGCVTWGEGGRWSWIRKNFYCGRADGRQTGTTDLTRHDIWRSVRMSAGFCPTVLAKFWGLFYEFRQGEWIGSTDSHEP